MDFGELQSQVQVLSSESIVLPVVRSMNLTQDSEFVGEPRSAQILQSIKKLVKRSIGWNDNVKIGTDDALERIVVEDVFNRLSVYQEGSANVINVTFASKDPNKAADIANAIADTYLAISLEAKTKSTKIASLWIQDRLTELRMQTVEADRALQNYRAAYNIVSTDKGSLNSERLSSSEYPIE